MTHFSKQSCIIVHPPSPQQTSRRREEQRSRIARDEHQGAAVEEPRKLNTGKSSGRGPRERAAGQAEDVGDNQIPGREKQGQVAS